jgi:hypothetical protein
MDKFFKGVNVATIHTFVSSSLRLLSQFSVCVRLKF